MRALLNKLRRRVWRLLFFRMVFGEAGAQIGKGAVISAYAQVRGEVPDFAIMAGQPAVQIGDVRQADALLLAASPWLAVHYQAWAGEIPT